MARIVNNIAGTAICFFALATHFFACDFGEMNTYLQISFLPSYSPNTLTILLARKFKFCVNSTPIRFKKLNGLGIHDKEGS